MQQEVKTGVNIGRNCQFGGRNNTARARAAGRVDGRAAYNADIAAKTFFRRRQSRAGCRGKFGAVDSHGNTRQIRIIRKGGARAQIGAAMIIRRCVRYVRKKICTGARCPNCAPPPRAVSAVSAVFGNAARKKIAYNARQGARKLFRRWQYHRNSPHFRRAAANGAHRYCIRHHRNCRRRRRTNRRGIYRVIRFADCRIAPRGIYQCSHQCRRGCVRRGNGIYRSPVFRRRR